MVIFRACWQQLGLQVSSLFLKWHEWRFDTVSVFFVVRFFPYSFAAILVIFPPLQLNFYLKNLFLQNISLQTKEGRIWV